MSFQPGISRVLPCAFFAALLLTPGSRIPAQNAPAAANPHTAGAQTLSVNADEVVVDVVVTNGKGEAARGITQADFLVNEDGKPRPILFFEEHVEEDSSARTQGDAGSAKSAGGSTADSHQGVPEVLTVLMLDTLNTPRADQSYVLKELIRYLKTKPANQRIAIFTLSSQLRMVQNFTTDSSALLASLQNKKSILQATTLTASPATAQDDEMQMALQREMGAPGNQSLGPEGGFDSGVEARQQINLAARASMTLSALNAMSRALLPLPGRKNLVWFSSSFPIYAFPDSMQGQEFAQSQSYQAAARKSVALLTASRIAIYPVSAQGIQQDEAPQAEEGSYSAQPDAFGSAGSAERRNSDHSAALAAMDELAKDTGGVVNDSTNDLGQAIAEATRNGSHYYTLAFKPGGKEMDGKYHRIEVKLPGKKVKLSYRRGYYAVPVEAGSASGR